MMRIDDSMRRKTATAIATAPIEETTTNPVARVSNPCLPDDNRARVQNPRYKMPQHISTRILSHVKSESYQPKKRRALAKELKLASDEDYELFKEALAQLMQEGRIA